MATLVGTQTELVDALKELIELEYDAIAAYTAAIDRLEEYQFKSHFEQFRVDHQRHVRELSDTLRENGTLPPTGGDAKSLVTQGKVLIGNLAGDRGILAAMRSNEDDTNVAYERVVAHARVTSELEVMLRRNLDDERRHRRWIEDQLSTLGGSGGDIPLASEEFVGTS